jgi:hypothetical protein
MYNSACGRPSLNQYKKMHHVALITSLRFNEQHTNKSQGGRIYGVKKPRDTGCIRSTASASDAIMCARHAFKSCIWYV